MDQQEQQVTVTVGDFTGEWPGESDEGREEYPEHHAYGSVEVMVDGQLVVIGCCVGVPDHLIGTVMAAGTEHGCVQAWFADASDHQSVPAHALDAVAHALWEAAPRLWREAQALRPSVDKEDVPSYDWETVAVAHTLADDQVCEVEIQIGETVFAGRSHWFVRTTDEWGGSDDGPDEAFASERAARIAANELREELDETDGLDADEYYRAQLEQRAGQPDPRGEWACVFISSGDEDITVARYATREQARAAALLADMQLNERHPGDSLLCGYQVHGLDARGQWVLVEEDAA